ncbi:hypothetical protein HYW73_01850 [Candidatus Nomurabacteria bacterium]|nr:hypothetical protein [Candidatus Nomurabacteria bacterium]
MKSKLNKLDNKKGISILGILFFGFILILVLSYFNVSVKNVVESPAGQENINYVKGETKSFWDKYLAEPASYLWNDVWIDIFWKGFISNMERIRDGKPTDYDKASENIGVNR